MELTPEELLLVQMVRIAIRDAKQGKNERLKKEARAWLWWMAPCVAERAEVPQVLATDGAVRI